MNRELSFEAMPFEFDSEFQGESFEGESESGGAQRSPKPRSGLSSGSTAGQRPGRGPAFPPARPKKPPVRKPSPSGFRPRGPRGVIREPYGLVSQPYSREPEPYGSERVRWVQDSLNRILGLRFALDGIMRPEIRSAVRSFQKREKLPVSGIVGPDTERALIAAKSGGAKSANGDAARADASADANEMIEFEDAEWEEEVNRSSGEYIKWVQSSLNRLIGVQLIVDGISGTYTRSAVRSFQSKQGLTADGIVGPITEGALIRAGAGTPPGYGAPSTSPSPPTTSPGGLPTLKPSFITIRSGVQLNPAIETAVRGLDAHFKKANLRVTLTSGVRSPESQLSIIRSEAIKRGIDKKYPAIGTATVDNIESWKGAWDELLNREGFIVNPPKYTCSAITGKCYPASPHVAGTAMDLSGADLDRIADVVRGYCREGGSISQILIERVNNAVHVGVAGRGGC